MWTERCRAWVNGLLLGAGRRLKADSEQPGATVAPVWQYILWAEIIEFSLPDLLIFFLQTQVAGLKASGITMSLDLALIKIVPPGRSRNLTSWLASNTFDSRQKSLLYAHMDAGK